MSSMSASEFVVMDYYYGPPGLTHPFFVENYAWVDQLLREKYYSYALTSQNVDEYQAADLLTENYAWVDERLEEMCAPKDEEFPLLLAPITWTNYRGDAELEELDHHLSGIKRKRSKSDISYYEVEVDSANNRLDCAASIATLDLSDISCDESDDDEIVSGPWWAVIHPEAALSLVEEGYEYSDEYDEEDAESIPYDIDDRSF